MLSHKLLHGTVCLTHVWMSLPGVFGQVWDYVGDNYVHRLIQSKTDGKLVEVPSPGPSQPEVGSALALL